MPKRRRERPGQIGDCWLSRRPNSAAWCRTWYECGANGARQTRRASLGTDDFEEAKLKLAEWVLENRRRRNERPEDVPVEALLVSYYRGHASKLPSEDQARIAISLWSDYLSGATVAELTPDRQEAFIAGLRGRGLSDGYISRVLSVERAALNRAFKRGELRTVPFVMDVEKGAPRDRRLSIDEAAALFEAAEAQHLLMYLMVAFNTLARPEAILDLQPFQVDLQNRVLHLNPRGRRQNAKRRPAVPITNTLRPWLAAVTTPYVVC